jgi:hypothetical protein
MAGMRKAYNLAAMSSLGDMDAVQRLLSTPGIEVNYEGHFTPALIQAARSGYVDIVKALIAAGANLNREYDHETPLIAAARNGHLDVIKALINAGADVNKSAYTNTALRAAAGRGYTGIVEALLKAGANVTHPDQPGFTPLWFNETRRYPHILRLFLRYGAVPPNPANYAAVGNLGGESYAREVVGNVQNVRNTTRRNKARSVLLHRALNARTAQANYNKTMAQIARENAEGIYPTAKRQKTENVPLTLPNELYREISRKYLGGKWGKKTHKNRRLV